MSRYSDRLLDPRWQRKRLEILQRSDFQCEECGESTQTLHIHHRYYISGRMPWEYPDFCYQSLCSECHDKHHQRNLDNREDGICMFEDWEHGLDTFGENLFDLADMARCGWNPNWESFGLKPKPDCSHFTEEKEA